MTRMTAWFTSLLCAGAVSVMMSGSAQAALFGFTLGTFTDGASLTVQFDGTDTNGDGVIYGHYLTECGCAPHPTEVTSLSLSFSGNSLVPAFAASSFDFASPAQTLTFPPDDEYGFGMLYVVSPSGPGVAFFGMPSGVVAGDVSLGLAGFVGNGGGPLSGNFDVPTLISILGAPCGSVLAPFGGQPGDPCAAVSFDDGQLSGTDQAFQNVPEPLSLVTFGVGLAGLGLVRRRAARG